MADLSDKEQLDAMRSWWSENGNFVIGGVLAGVLIIFGWNRWQTGIADTEIAASTLYEEVMSASDLGLLDVSLESANKLFTEYEATPYAAHARLVMARLYMDSSRDEDAAGMLRALIESAPEKELAMVGKLRLAKVLLYQGKAEEAVGLLQGNDDSAFAARYNELIGDAYVSMGSYDEAEVAYVAAMNDSEAVPTVEANLIQLKINDLPFAGEIAAAAEAAGLEPVEAASEDTSDVPESDAGSVDAAAPDADAVTDMSPESDGDPEDE